MTIILDISKCILDDLLSRKLTNGYLIGTINKILGYCESSKYNTEQEILPLGIHLIGKLHDSTDESTDTSTSSSKSIFLFTISGNLLTAKCILNENENVSVQVTESTPSLHFQRFQLSLTLYDVSNFTRKTDSIDKAFSKFLDSVLIKFASGYSIPLNDDKNNTKNQNVSLQDCLNGYTPEIRSNEQTNDCTLKENKTKMNKKGKKNQKATPSKKSILPPTYPEITTAIEELHWGFVSNIQCISTSQSLLSIESDRINSINSNSSKVSVIDLDILSVFEMNDSICSITPILKDGFNTQLKVAMKKIVDNNIISNYAKAFHYCPSPLNFPLTLIHLMDNLDSTISLSDKGDEGMQYRKMLHQKFNLPLDRPLFRKECAEKFSISQEIKSVENPLEMKLKDVHIGLSKSTIPGGKQYLVQGSYIYYHYLQDNINDKGWGCAYRSLQTLVSWFHLNHYISEKAPSHEMIQRALVAIGDKPSSFIGSNEWIGSMEVGFYLDSQMNISWKNISVGSGFDLAGKARELAQHFREQGTPIMMGGGNLAFTLLGIDWNEDTGDTKFLILDPHYCGADDLISIQQKTCSMEGYKATPCGWRTVDSFSKNSFYNLCLPQRSILL